MAAENQDDPDLLMGERGEPGAKDVVGNPGRSVNKKGLFIAFTIMGVVLAFVFYQLLSKGGPRGESYRSEEIAVDSLSQARRMTRDIMPSMPPEIPAVETKVAETPAAVPVQTPAAPPPPAAAPAAPVRLAAQRPVGPDPLTLEMMRLEQVRQKQFEEAIVGDVKVPVDAAASAASGRANPYTAFVPASGGAAGNARNRGEMLAAVRAEKAKTDALLQQYGSDANAVFQRQMAEIQGSYPSGGGSGPSGASLAGGGAAPVQVQPVAAQRRYPGSAMAGGRGNSLEDFDGGEERWFLDSDMDNPSQFMIRAGSVIPAVLLSGINSDLPGQILAQVSQNVYDTPTGRYLLIPQGTRLIGGYSSEVQYGQNRVFVAWQRLIFPDGRAYDMGAQPGTTGAGYAGLRDRVNYHLVRLFGSALLMSAVVGGVTYNQDRSSDGNTGGYGSAEESRTRMSDSLSDALGQNMGQVMVEMIRNNMNIAPTIEIRPGFRLNVMLVKDIAFNKAYTDFDYRYANR